MSESMDLETWLRKKCMSTKAFTKLVGCCRTVIWNVKQGRECCPFYAQRIYELTDRQVKPIMRDVGR